MTPSEYIEAANATKSEPNLLGLSPQERDIYHACIGLATEGGELLDIVKKAMFYGKAIDHRNLFEEMGDILWYVAIYCKATGKTFEQVMAANINKLSTRYPNKFTQHSALVRDVQAEMAALESVQ